MPAQWQTIDVPMGRGLDTKSSPVATEPGVSSIDINTEFTQTGGRAKRKGFNAQLGQLANGLSLLNHGKHLLAHAGGNLYDYAPAASGFEQVGTFRAVPVRAQVVRNNNVSITATDSFSLGGYTLSVWNDSTGVSARIVDEKTGAVVASKSGMFTATNVIKAFGMLHAGSPMFYVLAGGNAWRWRGDTQVWDGAATVLVTGIGTFSAIAVCPHGGNFTALWAASTNCAVEEYQWDFTFVGGALGYPAAAASSPACISLDAGGTFYYLGYNKASDGVLHGKTINATTFVTIIDTAITSLGAAGHVACAVVPGTANTAYVYDLAPYVGTTQAQVLAQEFSSSAFGVAKVEATLFKSVSLVSDMVVAAGLTGSTGLYFLAMYRSSATNLVSGVDFAQTLQNAATFVVSYAGAVCGRVFRGQSIAQTNTSSASGSSVDGTLVFGTLALAFSDQTTAQNATTFGGAAVVRVGVSQEKARGVSALQDFFAVGGSPSIFDGASVVEAGFHLFPECLCLGKGGGYAKNGQFDYTTNNTPANNSTLPRVNSTVYALGQRMNGRTTGMAAGIVWGHVFVCVQAGTTAGAPPGGFSITGGITIDGGVIWQDAGINSPSFAWAAGKVPVVAATGITITPTAPNGYVYVIIATGGGNTANDPGLATWSGAGSPGWSTTPGSTSGVLADGYNYCCVGTQGELTGGKAYSYVFTYEWVDDNGLLHTSAPSPIVAVPALSSDEQAANVLAVVNTLRLTSKSNVRIGVYRTIGDGATAFKIAVLKNNPAVDAIAFVDTVTDVVAATGLPIYAGNIGAGQLPNVPPPSCSTAAVWGHRVVTNSLENPYTIWPSKTVELDSVYADVPAWSDLLPIQVDASFGEVQALVGMDDKLVIFQDRRVSVLLGDGPDNAGGGAGFNSPQPIATDVGCTNPDSIVLTSAGVMFESAKGIYLFTRGGETQFIGAPIAAVFATTFNGSRVVSALQVPGATQVAFLDESSLLFIYDYFTGQWSQWGVTTSADGFVSLATYNGALVGLDDGTPGIVLQQGAGYADYSGETYGIDATLGPLTAQAGDQPRMRVRKATLQFSLGSGAGITISVLENYAAAPTYSCAPVTLASGQQALQVLFRKMELKAVALRIHETTPGGSLLLEALSLQLAVVPGDFPVAKGQRTS